MTLGHCHGTAGIDLTARGEVLFCVTTMLKTAGIRLANFASFLANYSCRSANYIAIHATTGDTTTGHRDAVH